MINSIIFQKCAKSILIQDVYIMFYYIFKMYILEAFF